MNEGKLESNNFSRNTSIKATRKAQEKTKYLHELIAINEIHTM